MNRRLQITVVLAALAALAAGAGGVEDQPASPSYEVTAVKRKLFREEPAPEVRLEVGARAEAGQLLRTGSRSSAEISVPEYGALFRLSAKTRARLAGDRPGVLLEVQRGSLRAIFDKLTGEDPPERLVTTPSAVLAVRGTEYGVDVSKSGRTTVTVFSGEVEVVDIGGIGEPVILKAGEYGKLRRGEPPGEPKTHQMTRQDWDIGRRPGSMSSRSMSDSSGKTGSQGATGSGAGQQQRSGSRPNRG
jgi:hypothetical protein